jgi:hypothetical protein
MPKQLTKKLKQIMRKNNLSFSECWICGSKKMLLFHHLDGNKENHAVSNLCRICRKCHSDIHQPYNLNKELIGKTYEQIHGKSMAKRLRCLRSKHMIGRFVSLETREKMSNALKGKVSFIKGITYEQYFGRQKAKQIKLKMSKSHKGVAWSDARRQAQKT